MGRPERPEQTGGIAGAHLRRRLLLSIIFNAGVPVLLYQMSKRYLGASELAALVIAALFPLVWGVVDLARTRSLDPVASLSVGSIVLSMVAVTVGGSPKLLLIRESFFTGAFGLACFISLAATRPLLFYFARHFTAGRDPAAIAKFNLGWERPSFRRTIRVMTLVWGAASLLEFAIRIGLVFALPAAAVLAMSPIILGGLLIATIAWTFSYGRRAQEAAASSQAQGSGGRS